MLYKTMINERTRNSTDESNQTGVRNEKQVQYLANAERPCDCSVLCLRPRSSVCSCDTPHSPAN